MIYLDSVEMAQKKLETPRNITKTPPGTTPPHPPLPDSTQIYRPIDCSRHKDFNIIISVGLTRAVQKLCFLQPPEYTMIIRNIRVIP